MENILEKAALFGTGGASYIIIELLWRGGTHWSMFALGGVCFLAISGISDALGSRAPAAAVMLASAVVVTALELVFGYVLNIRLRLGVWDYSDVPYNIMGQICPKYTALWFVLSYFCIKLSSGIKKAMN
jgi:uncharacterized membrane protein